ncbi:MAG: nicotinic acid mononucleotide adenylyltransferase, partial [Anaerolineae bacterium]|nr:nicotinic acid mononucleotide adenylyltransferase [Anaerolineae bacterium]
FLMGGDNLRDFPTWTHADRLIEHATIAVMRRSDEDISAEMHDDIMPGLSQHVEIVDVPLLSIWLSSTHIVERLQQGKLVRYLVPDAVLDYIMTQRLYTGDAS